MLGVLSRGAAEAGLSPTEGPDSSGKGKTVPHIPRSFQRVSDNHGEGRIICLWDPRGAFEVHSHLTAEPSTD